MTWLRIDDGFALHPKVVRLSRSERWTWVELLCYCARYRTDGELPWSIREALPKVNDSFLDKCVAIGLLDRTDEPGLVIHDWRDFNPKDPTAAERKKRQRSRDSHENVTEETVTENVTYRDSRADARARSRPVPSRPPINEPFLPSNGSEAGKDGRTENQETFTPPIETVLKDVPA